jgi:hypothetical protein
MSEKKDLKATKEMLHLLLTGVKVGVQAAADKKIDLNDAGLLFQLVPAIGPAVADAKDIPAELSDLSEDEGVELVAFVAAELAIPDAHARKVVEKALKAIVAVAVLVRTIGEKPADPVPVEAPTAAPEAPSA